MKNFIITTLTTSILFSCIANFEHKISPDFKQFSGTEEVLFNIDGLNSEIDGKVFFNSKSEEVLNNETMTLEKAINSGYIIETPEEDFNVNLNNDHILVYNIKRLDAFMDNIEHKISDRVRIVKYARENKKIWVNKLYDLEYNGQVIKLEVYDTYSDPNKFIKSPASYENKVVKRDYEEYLWYGICSNNSENDGCATLISLKKSELVR
ncbi:DUF4362 domain-containing protein [Clostridium folliculivorans]|uniref:Lipoprotein n=1 Tax=Clostridium folliculivorans TaxID=2886038 RepID=A0A9W5Y1V0_9CLOT|nr:DUF4362 domain-containing protein [Clostridium folliculivorans]GKU25060.1 hypothetical protein CFOLD11_18860 [Clostridium folliculivorans]GKU31158.1 hypothetical protein CFB3_32650 [Clostridium folliculivorans]